MVSVDGGPLASGKLAQVELDVWSGGTSSGGVPFSDIRIYRAANANSPSWTQITTAWPTVGYRNSYLWAAEYQPIVRRFILPTGALQAVRAVAFRSGQGGSSCPTTTQRDVDDLVFAVGVGDGSPVCGNNLKQTGEDCDGTDLNAQTCQTLGWFSGSLTCSTSCTFNTSGCRVAPVCGNGVIEMGEQCDGASQWGYTCLDFGFTGGTLACHPNCTRDFSGCGSGS